MKVLRHSRVLMLVLDQCHLELVHQLHQDNLETVLMVHHLLKVMLSPLVQSQRWGHSQLTGEGRGGHSLHEGVRESVK